jgi:hypothetical protein
MERLHAETALVEAELGALCAHRSGQTDYNLGVAPIVALQTSAAADEAAGTARIAQQAAAEHHPPSRRGGISGEHHLEYAQQCWAPSSTSTFVSCNCLGEAAHPKLSSRQMIKIVIGGWYVTVRALRVHS